MIIITWNANAVDRWAQLWSDPLVVNLVWDVICLQEVGNPRTEWHLIDGEMWPTPTDEDFLIRKYSYQTPFGLQVYITHCEWTNRQKNHLVMITRTLPSFATDLSGAMGERPCLGIKVRLSLPLQNPIDILIGCVHIVSSYKAPQETKAMLQYVDSMAQWKNCAGWILVGDFNANPWETQQATGRVVNHPNEWTQKNQLQYPIDYLVSSHQSLLDAQLINWKAGTAMSDHRLMAFYQIGGWQVQIL